MTAINNKEWSIGIKNGIDKTCTTLYSYKSTRESIGEKADLDVKVYICPCGQLVITDAKDKTGRGRDYTEISSENCGF